MTSTLPSVSDVCAAHRERSETLTETRLRGSDDTPEWHAFHEYGIAISEMNETLAAKAPTLVPLAEKKNTQTLVGPTHVFGKPGYESVNAPLLVSPDMLAIDAHVLELGVKSKTIHSADTQFLSIVPSGILSFSAAAEDKVEPDMRNWQVVPGTNTCSVIALVPLTPVELGIYLHGERERETLRALSYTGVNQLSDTPPNVLPLSVGHVVFLHADVPFSLACSTDDETGVTETQYAVKTVRFELRDTTKKGSLMRYFSMWCEAVEHGYWKCGAFNEQRQFGVETLVGGECPDRPAVGAFTVHWWFPEKLVKKAKKNRAAKEAKIAQERAAPSIAPAPAPAEEKAEMSTNGGGVAVMIQSPLKQVEPAVSKPSAAEQVYRALLSDLDALRAMRERDVDPRAWDSKYDEKVCEHEERLRAMNSSALLMKDVNPLKTTLKTFRENIASAIENSKHAAQVEAQLDEMDVILDALAAQSGDFNAKQRDSYESKKRAVEEFRSSSNLLSSSNIRAVDKKLSEVREWKNKTELALAKKKDSKKRERDAGNASRAGSAGSVSSASSASSTTISVAVIDEDAVASIRPNDSDEASKSVADAKKLLTPLSTLCQKHADNGDLRNFYARFKELIDEVFETICAVSTGEQEFSPALFDLGLLNAYANQAERLTSVAGNAGGVSSSVSSSVSNKRSTGKCSECEERGVLVSDTGLCRGCFREWAWNDINDRLEYVEDKDQEKCSNLFEKFDGAATKFDENPKSRSVFDSFVAFYEQCDAALPPLPEASATGESEDGSFDEDADASGSESDDDEEEEVNPNVSARRSKSLGKWNELPRLPSTHKDEDEDEEEEEEAVNTKKRPRELVEPDKSVADQVLRVCAAIPIASVRNDLITTYVQDDSPSKAAVAFQLKRARQDYTRLWGVKIQDTASGAETTYEKLFPTQLEAAACRDEYNKLKSEDGKTQLYKATTFEHPVVFDF